LTDDPKYKIAQNVMVREVKDGAVLLDVEKGIYFGLDPIGLQVWRLISEGNSLISICDELLEEYDVSRSTLNTDIHNLMKDLSAQGLVSDIQGDAQSGPD
jgi:hypothetical protein